jgi:hypothetical protein
MFMTIPGLLLFLFPGMLMMGMTPLPPFHLVGPLFLLIALMFISIPAAVAATGIGLLKYRDWARALTVILAALMLIGFPFGTAIGVYMLWVLLSEEGRNNYKFRSQHALAQTAY